MDDPVPLNNSSLMNDSSDNTEDPKDQDEIKELVVVLENRLDQLVKIFIQSLVIF